MDSSDADEADKSCVEGRLRETIEKRETDAIDGSDASLTWIQAPGHVGKTIFARAIADETARVWDARSGTCVRTLDGHNGLVSALAFSPSGAQLATGSYDASVRLWTVL